METDPCTVCGGTETNLIDGFYYCTECGTRDVNSQETVIEHTVMLDGTAAFTSTKKKIKTVLKDAIQMSGEWHKWHAFNFILVGLVKELMDLGASSGFKDRVFWIWTKYMNEFIKKDRMGPITEDQNDLNKSIFVDVDEIYNQQEKYLKNSDDEKRDGESKKALRKSIETVTIRLLLCILYLGLLYDRSPIQLSHLIRFISEKRLSLISCRKFVPKELDVKSIPNWQNFRISSSTFSGSRVHFILQMALSVIKVLELDMPALPDLRTMVDNFVTELCLPNHFKNLVFALMYLCPCDFEETRAANSLHNYEAVVMSYVLVALKMCFGLDDKYEIKISNAVEKINDDENRLKSYKLGMHSDPTNRLFSFREWSNYLQCRKIMLCKHYLGMAEEHNIDTDDYVFLEHLEEKPKKIIKLGDEITMDILNKIPLRNVGQVIPKSEFVASLTPLSSYTEVVMRYIQDPEVKLLLGEDFTQYSLKYACKYLKLDVNGKNIIRGVTKKNKVFNKRVVGTLTGDIKSDFKMVYVRNCENSNWMKTNPPTNEHITEGSENKSEKNSDYGYDSCMESYVAVAENQANNSVSVAEEEESRLENVRETTVADEEEFVLENINNTTFAHKEDPFENIEEEKEGISIFDDLDNDDVNALDSVREQNTDNNDSFNFWTQIRSGVVENDAPQKSVNDETSLVEAVYNPDTFDRARVIKELIMHTCKKYRINIPKDFKPQLPVKRPRNETNPKKIKKRKLENKGVPLNKKEAAMYIENIMSLYQASIEKDLLNKLSEHVNSFTANYLDNDNVGMLENQIIDNSDENQNSIHHENKDSSILETENPITASDSTVKRSETEEIEDENFFPKINPNFDEKTHDIKQLYVKCAERLYFEDILNIEDPEIEKLLKKKIKEYRVKDPTTCAEDVKLQDDEDEILLDVSSNKVLKYTKNAQTKAEQGDLKDFPKLIVSQNEIESFGYWLKHYCAHKVVSNLDRKELFDVELSETMFRSFLFVINQCSSIIFNSNFCVYKWMMVLEKKLWMIDSK